MNIKNTFIGKYSPILIAEIGGNHEGNFEYAKKLTKLAIDCDVDYVKFQLYRGDKLVSKIESPDRNKHFQKFELSIEQHQELAEMVLKSGIGYMASIWDSELMKIFDQYIEIYKVGSGDLTAYPILKNIVSYDKPIILSTGLANELEVLDAIKYIQGLNSKYRNSENLAILQCTSMYPIPIEDANLDVIHRYKELTGLTVGYSDHTEGLTALKYAYALGAEVLEFHFTDSREGKIFRDHKVSLTPEEVKVLQNEILTLNKLKGNRVKNLLKIEIDNGHNISFRRAVYSSRDIEAGEYISEKDLTVLRPLHGIDARDYDKLIGRKAIVSIKALSALDWRYFE